MTVNPRRPGFRLPWSGDDETQASASAAVDEKGAVETVRDAAEPDVTPGAEPEMPAMDASTHGASEPEPAAPEPGATGAGETGAPRPAETGASEANEFLRSLVAAMRSVAEEARDANLAELRSSIDKRVEQLRGSAAERADELRRRADLDIAGIEDWEKTEIERIRVEADQRRQGRRQTLDQQLADHEAATEHQISEAQRRLEEHERQLAAFFSQLGEIGDPAAFVAAARRMPAPPDLESGVQVTPLAEHSESTPGSAPRETLKARLEAMGIDRASGAVAAEEVTQDAAASAAAPRAEEDAAVEPTVGAEETAPVAGTSDSALAERLAELDQRLGEVATPAPAATVEPSGETSTAIVVKGLGSFGAITSFKQALERVEGVKGVTLSLGPTGEFVYRASHAPDFDVPAAIRAIEGESAQIEPGDGGLRVTVSRAR
jgi:hypothetical protein